MSEKLAEKSCVPCEGGVDALRGSELDEYRGRVHERWRVVDEHRLEAEFGFEDFAGALAFTNDVGRIAEEEGHHPEICLTWGRTTVGIWTHAIDGLSENDFILAAKIDEGPGADRDPEGSP